MARGVLMGKLEETIIRCATDSKPGYQDYDPKTQKRYCTLLDPATHTEVSCPHQGPCFRKETIGPTGKYLKNFYECTKEVKK